MMEIDSRLHKIHSALTHDIKYRQLHSITLYTIKNTRPYAALRAADLGWIVGPGYSLGHKNITKTLLTQGHN